MTWSYKVQQVIRDLFDGYDDEDGAELLLDLSPEERKDVKAFGDYLIDVYDYWKEHHHGQDPGGDTGPGRTPEPA